MKMRKASAASSVSNDQESQGIMKGMITITIRITITIMIMITITITITITIGISSLHSWIKTQTMIRPTKMEKHRNNKQR